jgi:hypothetical protein
MVYPSSIPHKIEDYHTFQAVTFNTAWMMILTFFVHTPYENNLLDEPKPSPMRESMKLPAGGVVDRIGCPQQRAYAALTSANGGRGHCVNLVGLHPRDACTKSCVTKCRGRVTGAEDRPRGGSRSNSRQ